MSDGKEFLARKGMASAQLDERIFKDRFKQQFIDPAFGPLAEELEKITEAAWQGYSNSRKSPRTRKAGPDFADPSYDLSLDWLAARDAILAAQARHAQASAPRRVLLINCSPRSENTCPGEMSKTWRLVEIARDALQGRGCEVEILDLSRVASEYGRQIHPCKACYSTAAALCHWPCSCYPNYSLGQTHDWMNDIYPMWVAARGVMIVTPVHWYQATSPLKLMMDRLVCADGGNPDPTSTHGKKVPEAKALEMRDWSYPKHLAGRNFALAVHGDAEGAENVRRALSDWLGSMGLVSAGGRAEFDRYIGYWEPYATSHEALDKDEAIQGEVRNAALTLAAAVLGQDAEGAKEFGADLNDPRMK